MNKTIKNKILFNYRNLYLSRKFKGRSIIANNCAYFSGVYDDLDNITYIGTSAFGFSIDGTYILKDLTVLNDGRIKYKDCLFDPIGRFSGNDKIQYNYVKDTDLLKSFDDGSEINAVYGKYGELLSTDRGRFHYKFINGKLRIIHYLMLYKGGYDVDVFIYDKNAKLTDTYTIFQHQNEGTWFDLVDVVYK